MFISCLFMLDNLINNEYFLLSDTYKLYEKLLRHKKDTDPVDVKENCLLLNDVIHKFIKTFHD